MTAKAAGSGISIAIIGAPMDLGSTRRGVDMGPSALRLGLLVEQLRELGHTVEDFGNVPIVHREALARGRRARHADKAKAPGEGESRRKEGA